MQITRYTFICQIDKANYQRRNDAPLFYFLEILVVSKKVLLSKFHELFNYNNQFVSCKNKICSTIFYKSSSYLEYIELEIYCYLYQHPNNYSLNQIQLVKILDLQ